MSPAPRIPFASSLADCIHRLARLQLTREMRPRPRASGVPPVERAIDRLVVAARRVARLSVVILALAAALSGCATPGKVTTDVWHHLTPAQRAEADMTESVVEKIRQACVTEHPTDPCTPPKIVIVNWGLKRAQYQRATHTISIPAELLRPEWPYRAAMAHELAHAWWRDSRDDCATEAKAAICEGSANVHAVAVLALGYGYSDQEAVTIMWRLLVGMVTLKVAAIHGHQDFCAELHNFEQRVGISPSYACQENGGRP